MQLKKSLSISFSLLLLLNSVGFSYGAHFCMGRVVDAELMLGHQHLDCEMEMGESSDDHDGMAFEALECCDNQYISLEIGELIKLNQTKTQDVILFSAVVPFRFLSSLEYYQPSNYPEYNPPIPSVGDRSRLQVFVI
ncbi:MAG: hypothetical protein ACI92W_000183 [Paraglaciecola sp.]|jgi:hypothetical protein